MPFHRHKNAAPATTNLAYQQNVAAPVITTMQPGFQTTSVQTTYQTVPIQPGFPLQTMPMQQGALVLQQPGYEYSAGAPLPLVQAPYTQQSILTKETVTTGLTTQMASTTINAGISKQTIVKPAIIQETIRTDTLVEVQPILHREIDQQRIHHVEQHITERAAPAMGGTVQLAPIIQETVRTNVVEEVQPIIHREVATRSVERIEEHLTERVAAPTVHTTGVALGAGQVNATIAKPAIIDERIRTDKLVEIVPVIHREIDQQRIHHVEQHITERAAPAMGGTVKLAPIVQETIHTNVIEEVQPVIHRERAVQQVQRVEEHLNERLAAPVVHTTGAALGQREIHATVAKPAIIDERVRTDRLIEVQPIVHREIEQPRIHHVEQHITERAAPAMGGTVKLAPIVQETVRTNVIEEVQPVIHRERAVQQVQRVEEHLSERVAAPVVHTTGAALGQREIHSTVAKPAIIDERVRTDRLVEVQPIVHREIEQPRIHHIEQHITERAAPAMGGTVKLAPIVQETVRTNVIEEVQPVIHRERAVRQVERVEEHLNERIAAAPIHTTGAALGQREIHATVAKPAIIDERIRTDRLVEIQPVVHREIDQQRVHHVEQHITEAPAPSMSGVVKMAPVIQQVVHTNVIEEVQPVIHREIATRSVERVEEHLSERVVAPVQHTHEVQNSSNVTIATLPRTQVLEVSSTPVIQTLNTNVPLVAPVTQGVPFNNHQAYNTNDRVVANMQAASLDKNIALNEKAAMNPSLVKPSAFAAGGPAPVATNLARPL